MDNAYDDLATRIISLAEANAPKRILIGVAGPPGSGKSTIVDKVVKLINSVSSEQRKLHAVGISLDGFHYTRAQLSTFSDPIEAHKRRGAPWTFDVDAVLDFIEILQASKTDPASRKEILAPTFDHALKDPVSGNCVINSTADIVILDGNYILLDQDGWRDVNRALDFRVFIHVDSELARARVAKRHVLAGIEPTLKLGEDRFDSNDALNGELVRSNLLSYDFIVHSV